jgi:hypothetical protein
MTDLKDDTLRTALMGAMATVVKDANEAQRKSVLNKLVDIYKDTGNKSWTIKLPSGDKIATITLNESSPEAVATNPDALLQWCKANRADLVETLSHPPVEAWTEERLAPHAVATIAKEYKLADTDYITDEGEPVEGVAFKPAQDPSKFTLSYAAKDRGASVVQAWRDGFIPIALDANLPQIGTTP